MKYSNKKTLPVFHYFSFKHGSLTNWIKVAERFLMLNNSWFHSLKLPLRSSDTIRDPEEKLRIEMQCVLLLFSQRRGGKKGQNSQSFTKASDSALYKWNRFWFRLETRFNLGLGNSLFRKKIISLNSRRQCFKACQLWYLFQFNQVYRIRRLFWDRCFCLYLSPSTPKHSRLCINFSQDKYMVFKRRKVFKSFWSYRRYMHCFSIFSQWLMSLNH